LQLLEKCCNALSNNMLTLLFVRLVDLVAPLNIDGSFYNTAIIKQNNMAYQHNVIFYIRYGLYTHYPSHTRVLKSGKPKPSQNGENTSNWVWFGRVTTGMGFVEMSS